MVDASQSPGLGYMEIVPAHDAGTLLPILRAPGTTIHSDQWRAYATVNTIPAVTAHGIVNHSLHFVDLATGVHTETVKTKLKRMKGCDSNQLASYLDEFLWRERYGKTGNEALRNIMHDISTQYPV